MNYIDIILIIPLLWGLYKGFTKGLIIEAATLIAFGLAIWGSLKFHNFVSDWMRTEMGWQSPWLPILAFAFLFIGVLLVVFGVAKVVEKLAEAIALGIINKLAGAVFGVLKYALILSVLIFFLEAVNKSVSILPEEKKKGSLLYSYVQRIAPLIIPGLNESSLTIEFPEQGQEGK